MKSLVGHLHVLTDETIQTRFTHVELATLAIAGGADTIQFRDKNKSTGELIDIAMQIQQACEKHNVPLVINDRADIALVVDAAGVHAGQRDLPVTVIRELLGPDKIVGRTASTMEEAVQAERDGADYVGFGHIYPTASKVKPGAPTGPDVLGEIRRALTIPVVAIGGIDASNFRPVLDTGVWGIAVIGAVCAQKDPTHAAQELSDEINRRFGEKE